MSLYNHVSLTVFRGGGWSWFKWREGFWFSFVWCTEGSTWRICCKWYVLFLFDSLSPFPSYQITQSLIFLSITYIFPFPPLSLFSSHHSFVSLTISLQSHVPFLFPSPSFFHLLSPSPFHSHVYLLFLPTCISFSLPITFSFISYSHYFLLHPFSPFTISIIFPFHLPHFSLGISLSLSSTTA